MTREERLILVNQLELLKTVENQNIQQCEKLQFILSEGVEVRYEDVYEFVNIDNQTLKEEDTRFVDKVLQMYRTFQEFKQLNPNSSILGQIPYFTGFDHNIGKQSKMAKYANFLIDVEGKFLEVKDTTSHNDELNSHGSPSISYYEDQLEKWERIEQGSESGQRYNLNEDQIKDILNI